MCRYVPREITWFDTDKYLTKNLRSEIEQPKCRKLIGSSFGMINERSEENNSDNTFDVRMQQVKVCKLLVIIIF